MRLLAGRHLSASRAVSFAVLAFSLAAAACSSDSPGVVSPTVNPSALGEPVGILNLANGPVVAQIKSTWNSSECVSVHNGTMANNSAAELQPCAGSTSQSFQFVSTGEIKIGSNYCLDVYDGASGGGGAAIVVRVCDSTGS